jgi:DnaK suppressor protein
MAIKKKVKSKATRNSTAKPGNKATGKTVAKSKPTTKPKTQSRSKPTASASAKAKARPKTAVKAKSAKVKSAASKKPAVKKPTATRKATSVVKPAAKVPGKKAQPKPKAQTSAAAKKPAKKSGQISAPTKPAPVPRKPSPSPKSVTSNSTMSNKAVIKSQAPSKSERTTKSNKSPVKAVTTTISGDGKGFIPYEIRKGEDYMNEQQKEHFKRILLDWRNELMQEVDRTVHHMQDEAANPPDPADRATLEEEFSIELRTRDRERRLIKKIDSTIELIANDEYGYCDSCGVEIGIRRLEARPTANKCIDCKTLDEIKEKQLGSS